MNTRTQYVRPGCTLSLYCRCWAYFGSGCGSVSLTLGGGASRGPAMTVRDNGFLCWEACLVTLPLGSTARLEEMYHPGGTRDTLYVADKAAWRKQRAAHLLRLFNSQRERRAASALRDARQQAIERRLRAAIARHEELSREAHTIAPGRSGGRARRRAARARAAAEDQRILAAALCSTWLVEIQEQCNQAFSAEAGLDSRSIRWEARRHSRTPCVRPPAGCEAAVAWMLELLSHTHPQITG
jgi:hypothetical protein